VKQEASGDSQPESTARKSGTSKKQMKNFTTPKAPSSSQKLKKEGRGAPGASLALHIPFKMEPPLPSQAPLPPSATSCSGKRERPEGGDEELAGKLVRLDKPEEEDDGELARKLEMEERLLSSPLGPRVVGPS